MMLIYILSTELFYTTIGLHSTFTRLPQVSAPSWSLLASTNLHDRIVRHSAV